MLLPPAPAAAVLAVARAEPELASADSSRQLRVPKLLPLLPQTQVWERTLLAKGCCHQSLRCAADAGLAVPSASAAGTGLVAVLRGPVCCPVRTIPAVSAPLSAAADTRQQDTTQLSRDSTLCMTCCWCGAVHVTTSRSSTLITPLGAHTHTLLSLTQPTVCGK